MYLLGILKIALGVPESTEGFRFGVELHMEILSVPQVSRVPVEKMLAGLHWVLAMGRGEDHIKGFCGEG